MGNKGAEPNKPLGAGVEERLPNKAAGSFFSTFFYYFLASDGIFYSLFYTFLPFMFSSGLDPEFMPVLNRPPATAGVLPNNVFSSFLTYPLTYG